MSQKDDLQYQEEIEAYLRQRPDILDLPAIQVYSKTLQMLNDREEEGHYQELKSLLSEHGQTFSTEELRTLYNYVLNFCIQKINSGESHYYREILDHDSEHTSSLVGMGNNAWARNDMRQAREFYLEAYRVDPTNYVASYNLSLIYRRLGDSERARHFENIARRLNVKP